MTPKVTRVLLGGLMHPRSVKPASNTARDSIAASLETAGITAYISYNIC